MLYVLFTTLFEIYNIHCREKELMECYIERQIYDRTFQAVAIH